MIEREVFITNLSAALPNHPVENDQMESILGLVGGKPSKARRHILRSNGIKKRYYVIDPESGKPTHSNAELTAEAIRKLASESFSLNDLQLLATGTTLPDQMMPNHGVMVHGELGIQPIEVVSNSGICLSGTAAMKYVYNSIKCGDLRNGISTGSEIASVFFRSIQYETEANEKLKELEKRSILAFEKDFLRWMLSDGAGAALLENKPAKEGISLKIHWIDMLSFAGEMETCMYGGGVKIDGKLKSWLNFSQKEVMEQSILSLKQDVELLNDYIIKYTVTDHIRILKKKYGISVEEIDYFLPHYSSEYFREKVSQGLQEAGFKIPFERWFTNLTYKGNTGSASIYIILEEIFHSGNLKVGDKLLCYIPESGRFSSGYMLLEVVSGEY